MTNFMKTQKNSIFVTFWALFAFIRVNNNFSWKSASVTFFVFLDLWYSAEFKKKNNTQILTDSKLVTDVRTAVQMNGWTDKNEFLAPPLLVVQRF